MAEHSSWKTTWTHVQDEILDIFARCLSLPCIQSMPDVRTCAFVIPILLNVNAGSRRALDNQKRRTHMGTCQQHPKQKLGGRNQSFFTRRYTQRIIFPDASHLALVNREKSNNLRTRVHGLRASTYINPRTSHSSSQPQMARHGSY